MPTSLPATPRPSTSDLRQVTVKQAADALASRASVVRAGITKKADAGDSWMGALAKHVAPDLTANATKYLSENTGPGKGALGEMAGNIGNWWNSQDSSVRSGLGGALAGGLGGAAMGMAKDDNDERHPWRGALTGAIAGGALGGGYGLLNQHAEPAGDALKATLPGGPSNAPAGSAEAKNLANAKFVGELNPLERLQEAISPTPGKPGVPVSRLGDAAGAAAGGIAGAVGNSASTSGSRVGPYAAAYGVRAAIPAARATYDWSRTLGNAAKSNNPELIRAGLNSGGHGLPQAEVDAVLNATPKEITRAWQSLRENAAIDTAHETATRNALRQGLPPPVRPMSPNGMSPLHWRGATESVPLAGQRSMLEGTPEGSVLRQRSWLDSSIHPEAPRARMGGLGRLGSWMLPAVAAETYYDWANPSHNAQEKADFIARRATLP